MTIFFVAFLWALTFPLAKIGVAETTPLALTSIKLWSASLLMWGLAVSTKEKNPNAPHKLTLKLSILGNAIPCTMLVYAESYIASNIAGVISTITPFFALGLNHKNFHLKTLLSLFVACFGVFLMSQELFTDSIPGNEYGLYLMLITCFSSACSFHLHERSKTSLNYLDLRNQLGIAAVIVTSCHFIFEAHNIPNLYALLSGLGMGFVTAIGWKLFYDYNFKYQDTVSTCSVFFLFPFFSCLYGYVLLGEELSSVQSIGAGIIVISCGMLQWKNNLDYSKQKETPRALHS